MAVDLPADDRLLNPRQQLVPFVQRQTQVGDILKTIGTVELNDAGTAVRSISE
jgi:hypothetical protein